MTRWCNWRKAIEEPRVLTILNTGIGWHEARVPTIATSVPRRAFAWVTKKLMGQVGIPVITSNRINTPEVAEEVLAEGCADMVSMARPFLADADFVAKAAAGQAAPDRPLHRLQPGLPGPYVWRQALDLSGQPARLFRNRTGGGTGQRRAKSVAIVGAGPAGLSTALTAAERGHTRHSVRQGRSDRRTVEHGQTDPRQRGVPRARRRMVRHGMVADPGIDPRTGPRGRRPTTLTGFDEVIIATGVTPRDPGIPGTGRTPNVTDLYRRAAPQSRRWATRSR